MKKTFFILCILFIFITIKKVDAYITSSSYSKWNFWYINSDLSADDVFISGKSFVSLKKSEYSPIILILGLTANQNKNLTTKFGNNLAGNIYLDMTKGDNKIKVGFFNAPYTQGYLEKIYNTLFINSLFSILYQNHSSHKADYNTIYLDGAYFNYNDAFNINYNKSFSNRTLNLSINYVPRLKSGLSSNNNSIFNRFNSKLGALEVGADYYNEFADLGLYINQAGRAYIQGIKYKGFEAIVNSGFEYMGFILGGGLLVGKINTSDTNFMNNKLNIKYFLKEAILSYSALDLNLIFKLSNYKVRYINTTNTSNTGFLGLEYTLNSSAKINLGGYLVKKTYYPLAKGLVFGFSLKLNDLNQY